MRAYEKYIMRKQQARNVVYQSEMKPVRCLLLACVGVGAGLGVDISGVWSHEHEAATVEEFVSGGNGLTGGSGDCGI